MFPFPIIVQSQAVLNLGTRSSVVKGGGQGPGGGVRLNTGEEAEGAADADADEEEEMETDDVSGGKVHSGLESVGKPYTNLCNVQVYSSLKSVCKLKCILG